MRSSPPAVRANLRQLMLGAGLGLGALLCGPVRGSAQQADPALEQDVQRIGAEASALQQSLPSFTCDEAATSQAIHGKKVLRNIRVSGNLRMVRKPDGRLVETYEYKHGHILLFIPSSLPLYVSGGFDSALDYFLPATQACYHYSFAAGDPHRIDFVARTDAALPAYCKDDGLKGYALLDASGRVTHIERTLPPEVAKPRKLATFAAVDLAPVELNGHSFNLSNHMIAEMPLIEAMGRFEATYSHCQLFTTTVTLGPSREVPPDATPNPQ